MPQTYAFQVSMPVTSTLPRDRISNTLHFEHSIGAIADTDLGTMAADLIGVYQKRYANTTAEIQCKVYDVDAKPNYPRATRIVNPGVLWTQASPRELALCLSFAGSNRGNKAERGRVFLNPFMTTGFSQTPLRPAAAQMTWALAFYTTANESFPDLGGVDWKFGVWSRKYQKFTQSQQAWVNDDWDVMRSRGLRESTRQSATREG